MDQEKNSSRPLAKAISDDAKKDIRAVLKEIDTGARFSVTRYVGIWGMDLSQELTDLIASLLKKYLEVGM